MTSSSNAPMVCRLRNAFMEISLAFWSHYFGRRAFSLSNSFGKGTTSVVPHRLPEIKRALALEGRPRRPPTIKQNGPPRCAKGLKLTSQLFFQRVARGQRLHPAVLHAIGEVHHEANSKPGK